MEKRKMINGKLNIYCEADGKYYPKYKVSNGVDMELDETHFIYVLKGTTADNSSNDIGDNYVLSNYYGKERLKYLKENHRNVYIQMKYNFTLSQHLIDIDKKAIKMENRLIAQYANSEEVTEELKKLDQMEWIRRMNNIKHRVREVVQHELIYVKP